MNPHPIMERIDVKIEIKSELKDESVYTENEILSLIKFEPKEDDDDNHKKSITLCDTHVDKSNNTQMKNNSCIWPCTSFESDVLKTEVQNNIVKEEPEDFLNEEHKKGLIQDSKIEITECDIKNKSDNFSTVEKVKTETALEDGDIVKESDLNIDRHCLEQKTNAKSLDSCDYINREMYYKKIHKSNLKRDLGVHTEERNFLCKLCNKKFFTKQILNRHIISMHSENKKLMNNINLKKMYKCSLCEYKSASNTCFIHHMNVHKSAKTKKTYQCNTCDFISIYESSLKRHFQVHTDKRHFQCQTCGKKFRTKRNLDIHIVSIHPENKEMMENVTHKINKCNLCKYKTISFTSFKIHVQRHDSAKKSQTLQCNMCDYKTIFSKNLKRHIHHHTSERRFPCQICDKTFSRKVDLDSHIVSLHSENGKLMDSITRKINQCSICAYKTISSNYFKIHVQRHKDMTTEPTYECDICGHKTLVKTDLIRHIQVHTRERSFHCRICDKKFLRKRGLNIHVVLKHSENKEMMNSITSKIHKCGMCIYKTLVKKDLIRHLQVHTGKRRFHCRICDKKFTIKQTLDIHIISKHSENKELMNSITSKIHKCDICGYKTVSSSVLKVHGNTHKRDISERPFQCPICDKACSRKVDLESHIVSIHSENKKLMDGITRKINKCTMCEYKTISNNHFKIHVQRHKSVTTEPTYQCDICGHKTLVKKDLIQHIQVHTREHCFLCRICDKKFLRKRNLDIHIVAKHSENKEMMDDVTSKVYKCDICEYKAVSSSKFKIHIQTHNRLNLEQQHS